MLRPIEKCARRALITASVLIALCAILVVPLAGSTAGYRLGPSAKSAKPEIVRRDNPWKDALVTITRDPFLPEAMFTRPSSHLPQPARRNPVGMSVPGARVRGLAFGQETKAIIELGGATKIVALGDFFNGTRVAAILADRVVLSDGSVLMFSGRLP